MSSTELHYAPLSSPEDDFAMVRRQLRLFAEEEQRRGTIPADILPEELRREVEQYVAPIVQALRENVAYTDLTEPTDKEVFLAQLLYRLFSC